MFTQKCTEIKVIYLCSVISFLYIFCRLQCVGHSFAYVVHFVFLGDVWTCTQRAAVASRCTTNLATHLPNLATHIPGV
jgi:hypothetical protein